MSDAPRGEWRPGKVGDREYPGFQEYWIEGRMAAYMTPRPHYCDRGHWQVNVDVPDLNEADFFPRYYMNRAVAVAETEAFIAWRLFKARIDVDSRGNNELVLAVLAQLEGQNWTDQPITAAERGVIRMAVQATAAMLRGAT